MEIEKSLCDICSPGFHCGLDVHVENGTVQRVTGTKDHPGSHGYLCMKGAANPEYVHRADRIRSPMIRGKDGALREASWQEAYQEIARRLLDIREKHGAESVVFYAGYPKWFRPWLHRLAYAFGSPNFGTESSSCASASKMAWQVTAGGGFQPDIANSRLYLGWGCNCCVNNQPLANRLQGLKEKQGRIIIVDPRVTPTTEKLADLHLQLRPGTDGALALGLCRLLLEKGLPAETQEYLHGLAAFSACVQPYTPEETCRITGVPPHQLLQAAEMICAAGGAVSGYSPSATITHHANGFNNFRAYLALLALAGGLDTPGGMLPGKTSFLYGAGGFGVSDEDFYLPLYPKNARPPLGSGRFPLWGQMMQECQMMDFARQATQGDPYPLKSLVVFGLNDRMFPDTAAFRKAVAGLDLVVDADLFLTDFARDMAHVVLPSCSSLERGELKAYPGGYLTCTSPAISPLYQSKPDTVIICALAQHLGLGDSLLEDGYEAGMRHLIRDLDVTLEDLQEAELPLRMPEERLETYTPGTLRQKGFSTPTGKVELYAERIAQLKDSGLSPLPCYQNGHDGAEENAFPFTLITGPRLPHALHSRLHDVPSLRKRRPHPSADIHPQDAARLGIREGDDIQLANHSGSITVKARLTEEGLPGDIYLYHGYREANANQLVPADHLDPYSGFPGYRQVRCAMAKA